MYNKEKLKNLAGEDNFFENEDMSRHTTFRAGGCAALFLTPDTESLPELIKELENQKIPYYIMGNGSNLLIKDSGYNGAIICMGSRHDYCEIDGDTIRAGAGCKLSKISSEAYKCGLEGMEFAFGIPGTFGGAVTMNAGAYGGEMAQVIESVTVLDENGNILNLKNDELNFGYRHSIVLEKKMIVLGGVLKLKLGDKSAIKEKMDDFSARRRDKQPLEYPSAGSTFKRPEGYFAGKLIMDAGLAGKSVGGAEVSKKHCGFIINKNKATATDILELIEIVTDTVYDKYGVKLETEVQILG